MADVSVFIKDKKVLIKYTKSKPKTEPKRELKIEPEPKTESESEPKTESEPEQKFIVEQTYVKAGEVGRIGVDKGRKAVTGKRYGFMLAESFYEADNGKIGNIDPSGYWLSEKFDGVRVIWSGEYFYTRAGNIVNVPDEFKANFPQTPLDGELFIKHNYFNQTSGIIRRHNPDIKVWRDIKYMVFDIPASNAPFEERMEMLSGIVGVYNSHQKECGLKSYIRYVHQTKILNLQHLENLHEEIIKEGGEGSIIRKPNSKYVNGRSTNILKVKNYADEDAIIIGWEEGGGKNTGRLGALQVSWKDQNFIFEKYLRGKACPSLQLEFSVGSGFKDSDRCAIENARHFYKIGTVIKLGFCGIQDSGKPRHPTFKGIRE